MPQYKLTYFSSRGLGEVSRLIFAYAKQTFEDVRIEKSQWEGLKKNFPFEQLPVLEVNGKQLAQSKAIARYLAKQFGLAGKDDFESAFIDSISDFQKDVSTKLRPYFSVVTGRAEGDKEALKQSVLIPTLDQYLPVFEKLLEESGSGFFAPSGLTWVDFSVAESFYTMQQQDDLIASKYPWVSEYIERVYSATPELKEYVAKRAQSPL